MSDTPTPAAADSPAGPYDTATAALRDSAKWLLGAFAAVGAVFAAGLQLASIGDLSWDHRGRLIAAVLGVLLTVGGVAVAIYAVSEILTRRLVTLATLATDTDLQPERDWLADSPDLLGGKSDVAQLRTDYTAVVAAQKAARDRLDTAHLAVQELDSSSPADLADLAMKEKRVAEAAWAPVAQQALDLDRVRLEVLSAAGFMRVSRAWKDARRTICLAAAAAALGITMFAWGANPPEEGTEPGQVLPPTPSNVNVKFTGNTDAVQRQLGKNCDLSKPVPAIAMTVTGQTYQVATVKTAKCASVWLTVTDAKDATVTARVEKKS